MSSEKRCQYEIRSANKERLHKAKWITTNQKTLLNHDNEANVNVYLFIIIKNNYPYGESWFWINEYCLWFGNNWVLWINMDRDKPVLNNAWLLKLFIFHLMPLPSLILSNIFYQFDSAWSGCRIICFVYQFWNMTVCFFSIVSQNA